MSKSSLDLEEKRLVLRNIYAPNLFGKASKRTAIHLESNANVKGGGITRPSSETRSGSLPVLRI